jgi:hypothetical protein
MTHIITHYEPSLPIRPARRSNDTRTIHEPRAEDTIGVLKHAVFQTDDNELRALEPRLEQATDVLGMRKIERGVDFIQDVHWRRLEL